MNNFARTITIAIALMLAGCGGGRTASSGAPPIDPSGNWNMRFTDAGTNSFELSALFDQVGSVVTAFHVLAAGNPAPFSCVPFSATFGNGSVLNVSTFSGDITSSFGNIHFTSTLNDAGTHAAGTYTLTGSCWGVASTGTFIADEVPSVSGSWSGTINCTASCPAGPTSGTITAALTQNDTTGAVIGTYAVSGLPGIGNGTVSTGQSDLLSGFNWQATLVDNNTSTFTIAGGPFAGTAAGLAQDRSFHGSITGNPAKYSVVMSH